jgi:hypothetical protein
MLCPGQVICAPIVKPVFSRIDLACVIIFTIEFAIRISLCWIMPTRLSGTIPIHWDDCEKEQAEQQKRPVQEEPYYSKQETFLRYFFSLSTFIDLASIIPTYLVVYSTERSKSLTYLRVFRMIRLLRVIRLNKQGRLVIDLIQRTLYRSREAIGILLFYLALIVLFFAAIAYAVEEGRYTVNDDYPGGAYLRPNGYGGRAESNFDSVPSAIYYVIVTICTVGYGDMAPTSITGRAAASLVCLLGILFTAMPISIISSNFSIEYKSYLERKRQFDRFMSVRDRRGQQLVKRNLAEASFTRTGHNIMGILRKYKTNRFSFTGTMQAPSEAAVAALSSVSERPTAVTFEDSSLRMDRIYLTQSERVDRRDSKLELAEDNHVQDQSMMMSDTGRELKDVAMDDYDSDRMMRDSGSDSPSLLMHLDADPIDYSMPSHIRSILSMSANTIERLDDEELRILFRELRGSYQRLFDKNLRVKELVKSIEEIADQIYDDGIAAHYPR